LVGAREGRGEGDIHHLVLKDIERKIAATGSVKEKPEDNMEGAFRREEGGEEDNYTKSTGDLWWKKWASHYRVSVRTFNLKRKRGRRVTGISRWGTGRRGRRTEFLLVHQNEPFFLDLSKMGEG